MKACLIYNKYFSYTFFFWNILIKVFKPLNSNLIIKVTRILTTKNISLSKLFSLKYFSKCCFLLNISIFSKASLLLSIQLMDIMINSQLLKFFIYNCIFILFFIIIYWYLFISIWNFVLSKLYVFLLYIFFSIFVVW